jgi:hypothetical protein
MINSTSTMSPSGVTLISAGEDTEDPAGVCKVSASRRWRRSATDCVSGR